jgi:putative SOS response-associated peptidase YedK
MCNHYEKNLEVLEMGLRLVGNQGWAMSEDGDIVSPEEVRALASLPLHTWPKTQAPVILETEKGRTISLMRWGVQVQVKNAAGKPVTKYVTNSRDDKLSGFTWRYCIAERRCLIPANAYYEPDGPEGAKWEVRFTLPGRSGFFIAGVWDTDPDGLTRSFSMVTTPPNALAARVQDRMPLVLDDEGARAWLGCTPLTADRLRELCCPFPAERMKSEALPPPERAGKAKVTKSDLIQQQGELLL